MYSTDNTQYTFIRFIQNKKKLHTLLSCFLLILIFTSCKKNNETSKTDLIPDSATTTPTTVVTNSPTLEPTPTLKPSASIVIGEEISTQTAQALLEDVLDMKRYSVSLLSDDIVIDTNQYIAFIATENTIPLEPILIVNKYNGNISCMSSEGRSIAFSNFPLKKIK